jgi:hypothetical protein
MYMEPPPPLLGLPITYQTLTPCNPGPLGVCAPMVVNNVSLAFADFATWFVVALAFTFLVLYALSRNSLSSSRAKYALPLALLIVITIIVSFSAYGSISSGASLAQPHWATPSGVEWYSANSTLYAGPQTTYALQGAHFDIRILNYHRTDETIILSFFQLTSSSGTVFQPRIYQCQTANSCEINSSNVVPPYSSMSITFYLGAPIQKGMEYSYNFTLASPNGQTDTDSENMVAS